jgi:hypothetical protein
LGCFQLRNHLNRLSAHTLNNDPQFLYIQDLVREFSRTAMMLGFILAAASVVQVMMTLDVIRKATAPNPVGYLERYVCPYHSFDFFSMFKVFVVLTVSYFSRNKSQIGVGGSGSEDSDSAINNMSSEISSGLHSYRASPNTSIDSTDDPDVIRGGSLYDSDEEGNIPYSNMDTASSSPFPSRQSSARTSNTSFTRMKP